VEEMVFYQSRLVGGVESAAVLFTDQTTGKGARHDFRADRDSGTACGCDF
jgi:hypothetical protein